MHLLVADGIILLLVVIMKYKVNGYAFIGEEHTPAQLKDGIIVDSWDQAHELMHTAQFENYLITISPVEEDE